MIYGLAGRILRIDLTTSKVAIEPTNEELTRKYVGGYGYASRLFYENLKTHGIFEAFSEKNPLIIMTGPLTGVSAFGAKTCIASRSPLTHGFSWAVFSGGPGIALKKAGFDGVVITGRSEEPVYVVIDDEHVEVKRAVDLWGLDVLETHSYIQRTHGKDFRSMAIGIAGEKLVKVAAIVTCERRVAARTGLGAVMGYKKLKAIAVRGTRNIEVYDERELSNLNRQ